MPKAFYVYVYRCQKGIVRYVGKGTGNRWSAHTNRPELIALGELKVAIHYCEDEITALRREEKLIKKFTSPFLLNKKGRDQTKDHAHVTRENELKEIMASVRLIGVDDKHLGHYKRRLGRNGKNKIINELPNDYQRIVVKYKKLRARAEKAGFKKGDEIWDEIATEIFEVRRSFRLFNERIEAAKKLASFARKSNFDFRLDIPMINSLYDCAQGGSWNRRSPLPELQPINRFRMKEYILSLPSWLLEEIDNLQLMAEYFTFGPHSLKVCSDRALAQQRWEQQFPVHRAA